MADYEAAARAALEAAHSTDMSAMSGAEFYLREAAVHASLEQAKWLREIADQFDASPRKRTHEKDYTALFPLHDAADLLEGLAIGDEGPQREMTIARLVLHQVVPYPHAERIAGDSRVFAARHRNDPWRAGEVEAAIALLKIDVPVVDAEIVDEQGCEGGG